MSKSPDEAGEGAPQDNLYELIAEHKARKYTVEERLMVVMRFVACGNLKLVERETGIPYMTMRDWQRHTEWWPVAVQECRKRAQDELDGTLTGIIHDITVEVADRVKNGDAKYDSKTGQIVKVPMQGKELATVAGILFDKRASMRGDPTTISRNATPHDQLKALEDKFKDISKRLRDSGDLAKPIESDDEYGN